MKQTRFRFALPVVLAVSIGIVVWANAGTITPPAGPVAPTMHTLDELFNVTSAISSAAGSPSAATAPSDSEVSAGDPRGLVTMLIPEYPGSNQTTGMEGTSLVLGIRHEFSRTPEGTVDQQPLTVFKNIDKSSPGVQKAAATGQVLTQVILSFYRIDEASQILQQYYIITLSNVQVLGASPRMIHMGGGDFVHMDEIQLSFQSIQWNWLPENLIEQHTYSAP